MNKISTYIDILLHDYNQTSNELGTSLFQLYHQALVLQFSDIRSKVIETACKCIVNMSLLLKLDFQSFISVLLPILIDNLDHSKITISNAIHECIKVLIINTNINISNLIDILMNTTSVKIQQYSLEYILLSLTTWKGLESNTKDQQIKQHISLQIESLLVIFLEDKNEKLQKLARQIFSFMSNLDQNIVKNNVFDDDSKKSF